MRTQKIKKHRLIALIAGLILILTSVLPAQAARMNVTATSNETQGMTFYPFDGSADSTDGLYNGTVIGSSAYVDGQVGQAIHLNGSDAYVKLPVNHALSNYNEITLSTWVNWKGGKDWQRIFDFGTGTNQYMFLTPKTGNFMRFVIKNGGSEQIVQTQALAVGQWAHVAVTLGNDKANLYVNGVLQASSNVTIKPSDFKPGINYIGKSQFAADALYNGVIDEFRIYNYALNAEDISSEYRTSSVDSALEEARRIIDKGQQYYSDETWSRLHEVYERAKALAESLSTSHEDLDTVVEELLAAIQNLAEPLPVFINTTATQLVHPAVSVTPDELLRVRQHILNKEQPWYGYYTNFAKSAYASKNYVIQNDKNLASDLDHLEANYSYDNYGNSLFNNQMTQDALAAYYQSLMYFMTGDSAYREKAMRIVLLWGSLDPSKAKYVVDAHIHQGRPMYYMNAAAELLRYTSTPQEELKWKDKYSEEYIANFQKPALRLWMENNTNWMNQHQTSVMGTLSSYVFMDSKADYERVLEWATVNASTPTDQAYHNGAIANAMFEFSVDSKGNVLDQPIVAVKEMVRDQPHSYDNIVNLAVLADIITAQGTLLDPVKGTATTANNGVDVYSFMGDSLLKGTNFYYKYNLGYEVPFNDGRNAGVSADRRGRLSARDDFYYIYKYGKGYTDDNPDFKYLKQALYRYWDVFGPEVNDSWLDIPDGALGTEVPPVIAQENGGTVPYQLEKRFTAFDGSVSKTNEAIRVETRTSGSQFAVYGLGLWRSGDLALRIKTNAMEVLSFQTDINKEPFARVNLPDTGGEWKYVVINLTKVPDTIFQADSMIYFNVSGNVGNDVEFDHLLVNSSTVKSPLFNGSVNELHLDSYTSAALRYDLSNSASNVGQTITYNVIEDNVGFVNETNATVDSNGLLSADIPASIPCGEYSFYVTATNGTAVNVLTITVTVTGSYSDAITNVINSFDTNAKYETASYTEFQTKLKAAMAFIESGDAAAQNQALLDLKTAVHDLRLLNPLISDGALDLSKIAVGAPDSSYLNPSYFVDNLGSGTGAIWISGNKMFTFDFGEGFRVKPSSIRIMPDGVFPARSEGAIILASNDYTNWVAISDDISPLTTDWTTYTIKDEYKNTGFRYFRMKDLTAGVLNKGDYTEDQPFFISEFHLFGERVETGDVLKDINLSVQNAVPEVPDTLDIPPRAVEGDKVTLTFKASEPISNVLATIQGEAVTVLDGGDGTYTAEYIVHAGSRPGYVAISIDYNFADGTSAFTVFSYPEKYVTNKNNVNVSQKILISNTSNEINPAAKAQITGSDNTLDTNEFSLLQDGKITTFPDVMYANGASGYYDFDFGADSSGKLMQLERLEILNASGLPDRAAAVSVSASMDGITWRTITEVSKYYNYDTWQTVQVLDQFKGVGFRYLRIYGGKWYGNISELCMFGKAGEDLNGFAPVYTIKTSANDPAAGTTLAYVNPNGLPPAPSPAGDEGATVAVYGDQTAVTVVAMPTEGYKFVKWVEPNPSHGIMADYLWTEYPVFNLTTYSGGLLGGTKTYNVVRDWNLKAVFQKIDGDAIKAATDPAEANGKNGWFTSPVTVTLSPADHAEFSLDDGNTWTTYDTPFVIGEEGIHQILYRESDSTDENEPLAVKLDLTAPEITVKGSASYTIDERVNITWNTQDTVSTVTYTTYNESLVNVNAYTIDPGIHTLTIEAEDEAGNRGTAEHSYSVVATFDSVSFLTGTFIAETGAPDAQQVAEALKLQLASAKLKAEQRKGNEARQILQSYILDVKSQSGKAFTVEQVAVLVRWAQWLHDITPLASSAPSKPMLSDDNSYDTGLKDGKYTVTMDLWWGSNGTKFKLYENGVLIHTQTLADNSPSAQIVKMDITGRANGKYTYICELTNSFGTTSSDPLIISVTDATPGMPVLSHNNWDKDGSYAVTMNLWWGTNGSEYRLYENDVLIDTQMFDEATPNAQKAVTDISGKPPGVYEYRAVLVNAAGETSSKIITVTVKE